MKSTAAAPVVRPHVAAVRRFNRFYTRQIGLLDEGLLNSPFSLTEVRTLYELAQRDKTTAAELCKTLGLDAGYLSRILSSFEKTNLIEKKESPKDARQTLLSLTKKGRNAFAPLNARSEEQVKAMLGQLSPKKQDHLVQAMQTIEGSLAREAEPLFGEQRHDGTEKGRLPRPTIARHLHAAGLGGAELKLGVALEHTAPEQTPERPVRGEGVR